MAAAEATAEKANVERAAAAGTQDEKPVARDATPAVGTQDEVEDKAEATGVPRTKAPLLQASTPGRLSQPLHLTNFR